MSKSTAKLICSKVEKELVSFHIQESSVFTERSETRLHGHVNCLGVTFSSPILIFSGGFSSFGLSWMAQQLRQGKPVNFLGNLETSVSCCPGSLAWLLSHSAPLPLLPNQRSVLQNITQLRLTMFPSTALVVSFLYILGGGSQILLFRVLIKSTQPWDLTVLESLLPDCCSSADSAGSHPAPMLWMSTTYGLLISHIQAPCPDLSVS